MDNQTLLPVFCLFFCGFSGVFRRRKCEKFRSDFWAFCHTHFLKRRKLLILRQFSIIHQDFPLVKGFSLQKLDFLRKIIKKLLFLRKMLKLRRREILRNTRRRCFELLFPSRFPCSVLTKTHKKAGGRNRPPAWAVYPITNTAYRPRCRHGVPQSTPRR